MVDVYDEDGEYVCITHQMFLPCEEGENHLISNWNVDVSKIRQILDKRAEALGKREI